MEMNATYGYITIIAMVVLMLAALAGGFVDRWRTGRGITQRFIQFVGIAWIIGATMILAVVGKLDGQAGTILGAIAGYLFGIHRRKRIPSNPNSTP